MQIFSTRNILTVSESRALRLMKTIQQMNLSRLTNLIDSTQNLEPDTSLSSNLLNETKRIQDIE